MPTPGLFFAHSEPGSGSKSSLFLQTVPVVMLLVINVVVVMSRLLMFSVFQNKRTLFRLCLSILGAFFLSTSLQAASVLRCSPETRQCKIRIEDGYVGNEVEVLNENAHVVAVGWIVKRQGSYAMIAFKEIKTAVRRGYPVIVKLGSKRGDLQWAASFSDKD